MSDQDNNTNYVLFEKVLGAELIWTGYPFRELRCPICQFNYQHERGIHEFTSNDNSEAPWPGRGNLVKIVMHGECGHEWEICLGFHKGNNYIWAQWQGGQSGEEGPFDDYE